MGHWGLGGRPVSLEELPYVVAFVRQSFERQMGSGGRRLTAE
jgi:predicted transport protein